ncbi:MAG: hypothetical protein JO013_16230 [Alphaproteobacteria bacterium]|nr:hypothetical protein [Alphaproteobacteria bacterium]
MPEAEAASGHEDANAPEQRAVRALLAAERAHAHRALPPSDASWRFLLALYEAALSGRRLTPAEAAGAAAVPPDQAEPIAAHFEAEAFAARHDDGSLGLTDEASDCLAFWVHALTALAPAGPCGVTPSRATAAAPPPAPPPEPPA